MIINSINEPNQSSSLDNISDEIITINPLYEDSQEARIASLLATRNLSIGYAQPGDADEACNMLYTSFGLEFQYVNPFPSVQTNVLLDEVYGVDSQASKLERTSHDRVLHEFHAIFAKSGQAVLGDHTYKILVLKEHTTIVGAVLYHTQKTAETTHTCTIELLGIQPTVQRSGYGTILATLTLEKERKEGCQKADLRTSVDAIPLYLKFGFMPSHPNLPKEEWYALTPAEKHKMIEHSVDTAFSVLTDLELDLTQSILQPRLESLLTCTTHFTAADYERKQAIILKDIPVPQQFDDWGISEWQENEQSTAQIDKSVDNSTLHDTATLDDTSIPQQFSDWIAHEWEEYEKLAAEIATLDDTSTTQQFDDWSFLE